MLLHISSAVSNTPTDRQLNTRTSDSIKHNAEQFVLQIYYTVKSTGTPTRDVYRCCSAMKTHDMKWFCADVNVGSGLKHSFYFYYDVSAQ